MAENVTDERGLDPLLNLPTRMAMPKHMAAEVRSNHSGGTCVLDEHVTYR